FFFNDPATTEIYTTRHTLSLHDALPIFATVPRARSLGCSSAKRAMRCSCLRSEDHTSELQSRLVISYAVFCLKKKKSTEPDWSAQTYPRTTARSISTTLP